MCVAVAAAAGMACVSLLVVGQACVLCLHQRFVQQQANVDTIMPSIAFVLESYMTCVLVFDKSFMRRLDVVATW